MWVRILPRAWMPVSFECCALTDRGLCDEPITRPEEFYSMWSVCIWSKNLTEGDLGPLGLSNNDKNYTYTPQYRVVWDKEYEANEVTVYFIFIVPCIIIFYWNNQQMQLYAVNFISLLSSLYMFRTAHTPIIRSTTVSTATGTIIGWRRLYQWL